jgi:hypothetical protein
VARLRLAEAALARLDELADDDAAPDAVIDRARASLQARIGQTRARADGTWTPGPDGLTERELRRDLISAENAELARLYENGVIGAATRQRLQRNLDLEATRLSDDHHPRRTYRQRSRSDHPGEASGCACSAELGVAPRCADPGWRRAADHYLRAHQRRPAGRHVVVAAAGHRPRTTRCRRCVRPAPLNRLAAIAGVLVLVAGIAGGILHIGPFFVPALVVLAVGTVKLWREQS